MNAIQFLLREHDHVRRIFKDISDESHRPETKQKMLDKLCDELMIHEAMEEAVWYPYLQECAEITDIIPHLLSEEKKAEKLIKEIFKTSSQEEWEEKFNKLKEDVEHHATEEETKLFPQVEKILDEEELEDLGKRMAEFKSECLQKAQKYKDEQSMKETSAAA